MPRSNASLHARPQRTRLVAHDADGTRLDSSAFLVSVRNRLARRGGLRTIHPDEVQALRGRSPCEPMRRTRLRLWKLQRVARDDRRFTAEDGAAVARFPGAQPALRDLHAAGVLLARVSPNSRANRERALGSPTFGLFAHAECGAGFRGGAVRRPRALQRSGVARADAMHIGDQATDAAAARKARLAFGAIAWGYATAASPRQRRPDDEPADFSDLAALARPGEGRP